LAESGCIPRALGRQSLARRQPCGGVLRWGYLTLHRRCSFFLSFFTCPYFAALCVWLGNGDGRAGEKRFFCAVSLTLQ